MTIRKLRTGGELPQPSVSAEEKGRERRNILSRAGIALLLLMLLAMASCRSVKPRQTFLLRQKSFPRLA